MLLHNLQLPDMTLYMIVLLCSLHVVYGHGIQKDDSQKDTPRKYRRYQYHRRVNLSEMYYFREDGHNTTETHQEVVRIFVHPHGP